MIPHAKEGQDQLALKLCPTPGFFLDIGMGDPLDGNNSLLLEQRGWKGFMFDAQGHQVEAANRCRGNRAIQCDVTTFDFAAFLNEVRAPKVIDYISMDVDDANTALVKRFPFDIYSFKVMTFETDRYNGGDTRKRACEEALSPYPQYVRICENVMVQGLEFEDFWINADYISSPIRAKSMDWKEFIKLL
jgi:hypothetical protein